MKASGRIAKAFNNIIMHPLQKYWFLFEELVKRDFKHRYKGTFLGMIWSVLGPLIHLAIMRMVYIQLFGRTAPHFTIYLFSGLLVFTYYNEATTKGMKALSANASIISKIRVPKYLFIVAENVSSTINFSLTLIIYFVFVAFDGIAFSWRFLMLLYPIFFLLFFTIGVGAVLSALYIFFRDTSYLYANFIVLLRYMSAIFYQVDRFEPEIRQYLYLNPVYCYILYFRTVVIDGLIPSTQLHLLCAGYAVAALLLGMLLYKRLNRRFSYYL